MRTNFICLVILALLIKSTNLTFAQGEKEQETTKYLIDLNRVKLSGYGNLNHELSFVDESLAYSSGLSGAFLFDYKYLVGIYSYTLNSRHLREDIYPEGHSPSTPSQPTYTKNRICFNHGGLMVGYIFNYSRMLHLSSNIKFGQGRIALVDRDIDFSGLEQHHHDWVGVFTPEIDLELNLTRWCKLGLSLGYRTVFSVNDDTYINAVGEVKRLYNTDQFSSPTISFKVHFGSFGPKENGVSK
jgi:hypothetical protein